MSENIEIDIELSNEQIIELLQVIDRSKTGAKFELKEVTKYTSLELESIIRNYPVIQTALEIKENEIAERLEAKAFNSIMSKEYLGQGDSVFWKTMIESRGKKLGYGSDTKRKTDDESNNVILDLSDDEIEMELQELEELSNDVVISTDKPKSYLQVSNTDDTKNTTKSKENKSK